MKINFPIIGFETPDADDESILNSLYVKMPSLLAIPKEDVQRQIIEQAFITGSKAMDNRYLKAIMDANDNYEKILKNK